MATKKIGTTIKVASKTPDGDWSAFERTQYMDGTSDKRTIPASDVIVPFEKALANVCANESTSGKAAMMAKEIKLTVHMRAGGAKARIPNVPAVCLGGSGQNAYLWVGNDAEGDKWCFATVRGAATLRKLAKAILAAVGK